MSVVKMTVRIKSSQFQTLNSLAKQQDIPRYRMLSQIIDRGFTATVNDAGVNENIRNIAFETGTLSARVAVLERLVERALFVNCAAYVYARHAVLNGSRNDDELQAEAQAAFQRQLKIAEGG
ncbi:hypothetical protein [Parasphingorhabdus flavimaris]|uniref:hypothetical protein n=1 Tax=Parasphingorhabdus flavimaris TaxID=266812 RepID=UPI00300302CC